MRVIHISKVRSSLNPADPFLYYCHSTGDEAHAGVVDVREMIDRGRLLDETADCVPAADGKLVYRQKSPESNRIECRTMTSSFDGPAPTFPLMYSGTGSPGFAPDPFGQFAFAGKFAYTQDLKRPLAELPAAPLCFFQKRPVIMGLAGQETDSILLQAISYNSFAGGATVVVGLPGETEPVKRIRRTRFSPKQTTPELRVIADDARDQVIVAFRNNLRLVPLEAFGIQDAPFLVVDVEPRRVTVGVEQTISISNPDKRVSIELSSLPDGAVRTDAGFTWTPPAEAIGPVIVTITLKSGETQRTLPTQFQVEREHYELPFHATGIQETDRGDRMVCWNSPNPERVNRYALKPPFPAAKPPDTQLAVVDPTGKAQPVVVQLPYVAGLVAPVGNHVFVASRTAASRLDVFRLEDLSKVHVLNMDSDVVRILQSDDTLMVEEYGGVEIFDREKFNRHAIIESANRRSPRMVRQAGILQNGRLRSFDNETLIVVTPDVYPTLSGADGKLHTAPYLPAVTAIATMDTLLPEMLRTGAGKRMTAPLSLRGGEFSVVLEEQMNRIRWSAGSFSNQQTRTLSLSVRDNRGAELERIMIERRDTVPANLAERLLIAASGDTVFVGAGRRLYRSKIDLPAPEKVADWTPSPRFELRQSLILLDKDGQSVLEHRVIDGDQPVTVRMVNEIKGAKFDPKSLQLTLDNASVFEEARKVVVARFQLFSSPDDIPEKVTRYQESLASRAALLTGRPLKGIPVAVPVHLTAFDNFARTTELQYFVFAEVDPTSVIADIADAIRDRKAQRAAQARQTIKAPGSIQFPSSQSSAAAMEKEISQLNKRVDGLEAQLDLVTGQLNQVLKLLRKKASDESQPDGGAKDR